MMNMHILHEQLRKEYEAERSRYASKPLDFTPRTEETSTVDELVDGAIKLAAQGEQK